MQKFFEKNTHFFRFDWFEFPEKNDCHGIEHEWNDEILIWFLLFVAINAIRSVSMEKWRIPVIYNIFRFSVCGMRNEKIVFCRREKELEREREHWFFFGFFVCVIFLSPFVKKYVKKYLWIKYAIEFVAN